MTHTPAKRPQLSPARPLAALAAEVQAIERPHPNLLLLYALQSLAGLVAAPLILLPLYFRYHTLRYRFDDDGVHASWGILFRREISLTYARIQDIHLSRGIFERWLGLGTVQIQTASGSALAELSIEGTQQFVTVRDFLYAKMRGAQTHASAELAGSGAAASPTAETVTALHNIRDDLRAAARALGGRDA